MEREGHAIMRTSGRRQPEEIRPIRIPGRPGLVKAVLLIPVHLLIGLGAGLLVAWMSFEDARDGRKD
jgi:hypothetical protein